MADAARKFEQLLQSQPTAEPWLKAANVHDLLKGYQNLLKIASLDLGDDISQFLMDQLAKTLPELSDADMALNNFERFLTASKAPVPFGTLCQTDQRTLPDLLTLLSNSQFLSDVLIRHPDWFDKMYQSQGNPLSLELLSSELETEMAAIEDDKKAMSHLNSFKRRHLLRIVYGDIIRGQTMQIVTRQISYLAEAICRATLRRVGHQLSERYGTPRNVDGKVSRFVVLALGKFGGTELNYSSDIDLIFVYDQDGQTDGVQLDPQRKSIDNIEYFDRLAKKLVQHLTQSTPNGAAYRVDLRLRPEGSYGPSVMSRNATLRYYDVSGRTWERQAMVKARPIAGALEFGRDFLHHLSSWIYRSYLSQTEIAGIKALKRQIERRAAKQGNDHLEVKAGPGGIRDVEFVIQFLQLLMGADFPQLRTGNTLDGVAQLAAIGGISKREQSILEQNYVFLRKIEHRLQIMFDGQTHRISTIHHEQQMLALRLGYRDCNSATAAEQFKQQLTNATSLNRRILNHLLHNTVGDEGAPDPEIDLILDPNPDAESMEATLKPYGFNDPQRAHQLLMDLATERLPFLPKRRCRHFLATISRKLLFEVSKTADPEHALAMLSRVSEPLGGKAALWELLNTNHPSLELYVRLCAACPYLSDILISNPGMLDELLDSLLLERLPSLETLEQRLARLCGRADDIEPILASFKHAAHLRVGARDIVGKETIRSTTRTLSDIAEVCFRRVAEHELRRAMARYGKPIGAQTGKTAELVILAAGKVGGREPNYHSDIDVIFLFDEEGTTEGSATSEPTSNSHFFSNVSRRVIQATSKAGRFGTLYAVDARLRPTGKNGPLVVCFDKFSEYFQTGSGQLWERLALCNARPITGSADARQRATQLLLSIVAGGEWRSANARQLYAMRLRMQETAHPLNLKRGPGGTVDLEFAVQMHQLRYGHTHSNVLSTGVWQTTERMRDAALIHVDEATFIEESYSFLRSVEARLRLINTEQRHDFPSNTREAEKLAYLMRTDRRKLQEQCVEYMGENRKLLESVVQRLGTC